MDLAPHAISQPLYDAWHIRHVIASTAQPDESPEEMRLRWGVIVETFDGFAPTTAIESTIAAHCVSLQFMLRAAMSAANDADVNADKLKAMRSSAMGISRTLLLWVNKLEKLQIRNEKRAAAGPRTEGSAQRSPDVDVTKVGPAIAPSPAGPSDPAAEAMRRQATREVQPTPRATREPHTPPVVAPTMSRVVPDAVPMPASVPMPDAVPMPVPDVAAEGMPVVARMVAPRIAREASTRQPQAVSANQVIATPERSAATHATDLPRALVAEEVMASLTHLRDAVMTGTASETDPRGPDK